ncbi:MAG: hypothetical protein QM751_04070 [Paludibacteraceae bacterium]
MKTKQISTVINSRFSHIIYWQRCKKVDIDVTDGGEGYILYEGTKYSLNILTIITTESGGILSA